MMYFLILNIANDIGYLAFCIRKSPIPFLPGKWMRTKILCFNPFAAFCFYILSRQLRDGLMWPHSNKNMNMVRHAVYLQHFVLILLKNTSYILMQPLFPFIAYNSCPVFYRKHKLNMNLRITICHRSHHFLQFEPKALPHNAGFLMERPATNLPVSSTDQMFPRNKERLSDEKIIAPQNKNQPGKSQQLSFL